MAAVDTNGAGDAPDLQSWMAELQASSGARWYTVERVLPPYHDEIAATGFLEELTNPASEVDLRSRWGGGHYKVTAKGVGKGRGKKNLDAMSLDISGPPRAYPGSDGAPVLFPSAAAAELAKEEDVEDDGEEDEDDVPAPRRRRFAESRGFDPRDRDPRGDPRDRGDRMRYNDAYVPPRFDAVERLREASLNRNAGQANTDAMRILNEASSTAQSTLATQLESRDREIKELRDVVLSRDDRAERPFHEALAAFKTRMEEQRQDFNAQITSLRSNYDQQLSSLRSTHEQQLTLLNQRREDEMRSLASRHEGEIKTLQREIDRSREDVTTRVREANDAATRRVQEVKDLLAAQYETRIVVLQSERDAANRRGDEARVMAEKEVGTRVSDERRTADQRETLLKTMLEGREQMQVGTLSSERDRLREEVTQLRLDLTEARKAADPTTSMKNVASMAEAMKSLGLAGPVGGGPPPEETIPDDFIGKAAHYLPRVLAAAEPALRRGAEVRNAQIRLQEQEIQAKLQAHREAIQAQARRQQPQQIPQQQLPQQPRPQPPAPPQPEPQEGGLPELLSSLEDAFTASMPPPQVAQLVRAHLAAGGEAETKETLDALLARPGDEVSNELSVAAEAMGYTGLATPRGTLWLEGVHRALSETEG